MPRGRPKKQKPIETDLPKKKRGRPRKVVTIVNPPLVMEEVEEKPRRVFKKLRKPRKKRSFIPRELWQEDPNATVEEQIERREKLSEMLPKVDPFKPRVIIDLAKDAKECAIATKDSCHRPDIYLDYGCWHCSLVEHCACKIKMVKKSRKSA